MAAVDTHRMRLGGVEVAEVRGDNFWRWAAGGNKKAVVAVAHGLLLQGCQVLAIGPDTVVLLVRNSWGATWAMQSWLDTGQFA